VHTSEGALHYDTRSAVGNERVSGAIAGFFAVFEYVHVVWTAVAGEKNRFYKNGALMDGTAAALPIVNLADAYMIGKVYDNYFQGTIDELAFYAYALSNADVVGLYAGDSETTNLNAQLSTFLTTDSCASASGGCGATDVVAPPAQHRNGDELWYQPYNDSAARNWAGAPELLFSADMDEAPWAAGGYRLWYGDDLQDRSESVSNNGGRACVDVFYRGATRVDQAYDCAAAAHSGSLHIEGGNSGSTGGGHCNFGRKDDAATFSVPSSSVQRVLLRFRYALGASDSRRMVVSLNGNESGSNR
jgi:hypothetical protein